MVGTTNASLSRGRDVTNASLSRRDIANVARQFIAWYERKNGNCPGGYGMIRSERCATIRRITQLEVGDQTVPSGTDSLFGRIPGNKLPGYDH